MKRVMVNLDDKTGELLDQKIQAERRSASSYVVLLIEKDLRAAGLLPPVVLPDQKEILELVSAAVKESPGIAPKLKDFIADLLRPLPPARKRRAA